VSETTKPYTKILTDRAPRDSPDCVGKNNSLTTAAYYLIAPIAIFILIVWALDYNDQLNEADLYRVLLGLLNGQASGLRIHDPSQYGMRFSYGYVAMIYWLGGAHIFDIGNRENLIHTINEIGFLASAAMAGFLMASLRAMYDLSTSLLASLIFLLSSVVLEMATSGHQLLIALAFFFAANLLLVLDIAGWWRVLCYVAATILLFFGLTMRAELPLAFFWLAFAQRPRTVLTQRQYILGIVARSAVCSIAFVIFQIVYRYEVYSPPDHEGAMTGLLPFLRQFYNLNYVFRGCVILVVGCGLATVALGVTSLIIERTRILQQFRWPEVILSRPNWLGPLSLIASGTIFWLPNPYPARHFTFIFLGIAVLIAIWITRRFRIDSSTAIAVALVIVIANQALAELVRPLVLRNLHSVYLKPAEHNPTTGVVPLGSFARHHASLSERYAVLTNFGRMVTASCEPRLLILTSNGPLMAGLMFEPNANIRLSAERRGTYEVLKALRNNQTFLFIDPQEIWPQDPVPVILNDPELDGYQILRDPYSISSDDKLAVPGGRIARYPSPDYAIRCGDEHWESQLPHPVRH
jgi:hypothetical protein